MPGQGAVASLTRDHHMLALFFLVDHIRMAPLAYIVAGKRNWPGRSLSDGGAAIVPVLPEAARNHCCAQGGEYSHRDRHDDSEPNQVFRVFEQWIVPSRESARVTLSFDTGVSLGER